MASPLDFKQNQLLLNPALPASEQTELHALAEQGFLQLGLSRHVALATSGSSRQAGDSLKLVFLSEEALMTSAEAVNRHLGVTEKDIWCASLPNFHVGGLGVYLRAQRAGIPAFPFQKWDPIHFVDFLHEKKVTLVSLVPTQVFDLVSQGLRAPVNLRAVIVGGAALSTDLYAQAQNLGWPLLPSYGMTETCSQIATASLKDLDLKKMPLPVLLDHVQLTQESEETYVTSKSLLTSYGQIKNGQAIFWDPKNEKGQFKLEDQVSVLGLQIQILGRRSDYFKISGEALLLPPLQEIFEQVVIKFGKNPQDYFLTYLNDPRTGSQVVLYASSQNQIDELCESYKALVLPVAKIRKVISVASIPRTALGKVQFEKLKETQ